MVYLCFAFGKYTDTSKIIFRTQYATVVYRQDLELPVAKANFMFRAVFWVILQYAPLKRRPTILLHGSITQKTALNIILAAVRT
jgi:hypothetical protein